jgi:serine/threonine protein kinase
MQSLMRQPGDVLAGRYEIDRLAGSGGMSTVYRARDRNTGQLVALKLLQASSPLAQETGRFMREAHVLAELRHPGIVGYLEHGLTPEGHSFLAMEWLDGEDLARRLQRGPLSIAESLYLVQQTAAALQVAHQRGIVHRDLKPSNLFLRDGEIGRVTLLDFGIARHTLALRPMTQTGVVVGTPEYMAPEQARGHRDIGASADVFSLGCVLYECVAGQPPFVGEHVAAILARILFADAPALSTLHPHTPPQLDTLLGRMLAKTTEEFLAA